MRISFGRLLGSALLLAGVAGCFEPARAFSAAPSAEERSRNVGHSIAAKPLGQKPPFVNTVDSEHRLFYFDIQNSFVYSFVILFSSLGAAAIGFRLQRTGQFDSLTDEHRSASRSALGLATILTAIVIGVVSDDAISTWEPRKIKNLTSTDAYKKTPRGAKGSNKLYIKMTELTQAASY